MVNTHYNYIQDLNVKKDSWILKVKILSFWKTNWNFEMIIMDEKNDKIHATIKHEWIHSFEKKLREGFVVIISKFMVTDNKVKFPATTHKYKITLLRGSVVNQCDNFEGSDNGFDFFSFSELMNHKNDEHLPVDIIGCVVDCGDLTNYNKDKEGKIKGVTTYQNALFGTKLWTDECLPEIKEFRSKYLTSNGGASSSNGSTILSSKVKDSTVDDFLNKDLMKTIDEIVDLTSPGYAVVLAKTSSFQEEHGWNYIGCRRDKQKVIKGSVMVTVDDFDDGENNAADGRLFKVHVRVQDLHGTTSFILFDTDIVKLLNVIAADMVEKQQRDGIDDFPSEFVQLEEKKFLFKVEVSKFNVENSYRVYTCQKLCSDPAIISEFIKEDPKCQLNEDEEFHEDPVCYTDVLSDERGGTNCGSSTRTSESVVGDSSTGFSPLKKTIKQEPGTSPTSVKSSSTKSKKSILSD
ncbi:uncharacterized protein [Rutidosis leptorrhynchoides]|uniref:uncharacterized protein n=1 Tax=Rutidosis leptorrhynchoides TaxID=125765 RepID=UPI003A9A5F4B